MRYHFTFIFGDHKYQGVGTSWRTARRDCMAKVPDEILAEIRAKQSELPMVKRLWSRFVMRLVLR